MRRRVAKQPSEGEVERYLLQLEGLGILDRDICYMPMMTDDEDTGIVKMPRVIPPRLFCVVKEYRLVHCVGSMEFYALHPEYEYGGLSYECYVLDVTPRHLLNYCAMEATYIAAGVVPAPSDILSLRTLCPPPLTRKQLEAFTASNRRAIKARDAAILARAKEEKTRLTLVKR